MAIKYPRMEREIAFHTKKRYDELLEIWPLIFAEPMSDAYGVVSTRFIFTPHAHRGSVLVNDRTIHIEFMKSLNACQRKQFQCTVVIDAIQHPADGIIIKHVRRHILAEKERYVTHAEKLLYTCLLYTSPSP